jgi:uncharacterized protein (TIGR03437 family)
MAATLLLLVSAASSMAQSAVPTYFESNEGQAGADVRFLSRGDGYTLLLKSAEAVLVSQTPDQEFVVSMRLLGGDGQARLSGVAPLSSASNYFIGSDQSRWRTGVPHFSKVRYEDVYTGIDLLYYGAEGELEYDFVVSPGADPDVIQLQFEGAGDFEIDAQGNLAFATVSGRVTHRKPLIYQDVRGERRIVGGGYRLAEDRTVGFDLDPYDRTLPLVIDPVIAFATLFGGGGEDTARAVDVDSAGNIYMAGVTDSMDLPVAGSAQAEHGGALDIFVAKLNPAGTELIFAAYLGGSGLEFGDLAVDAAGNAYLTGVTTSSDFPAVNALAPDFGGGGTDAFVAKLDPSGSTLIYSTYLGGSSSENEGALGRIAVDSAGAAYVTGITDSLDFPTVQALQPSYGGGVYDAFVTKISPDGSALVYSTYLGGSGGESEYSEQGIGVDGAGNAYITGSTDSTDFPTANAMQGTKSAAYDAFVTKLNPAGSLVYSTYLGREGGGVAANDIAVDDAGNAYITGYTTAFSPGSIFPGAGPAPFPAPGGLPFDGFVSKLSPDGSTIVYSAYVASPSDDFAERIAVDAFGSVWVSASTGGTFPVTPDAVYFSGNKVLARLNSAGETASLTYFPSITDMAPGETGELHLVGFVSDWFLPFETPGVYQTARLGTDAYLAKMGGAGDPVTSVSAADYEREFLAPASIVSSFAPNFADRTTFAEAVPLPTELDGVTIAVVDAGLEEHAAELIVVTPQQINWVLPAGLPEGPARVTVSSDGGALYSGIIYVFPASPGLFSADSSGTGVAAGLSLLVKSDGSRIEQPLYDPNTQSAVPIDMGDPGDEVFLTLFGTGLRNHMGDVVVIVGSEEVEVTAAVPHGSFVGLDQVNLGPLPRSLAGKGVVEVDAAFWFKANPLTVTIGP